MEKKLEKMRAEMKRRLAGTCMLATSMVILMGVVASGVIPKLLPNSNPSDFINGFQIGVLIGILCVTLSYLVKYQTALKDEAKLKQLYYKENDEREKYIRQMAGSKSAQITLVILLIAAVITGYFSKTAFFSLLGATLIECLVSIGVKLYYSKTTTGMEE